MIIMKKNIIQSLVFLVLLSLTADVYARNMITNKGSDTLLIIAQAWSESYQNVNKDVAVSVNGGGTGIGIAALINGVADIANASRKMKYREKKILKKQGFNPFEIIVGYDALAIYLHKNNPLDKLSLTQLGDIDGEDGHIDKWTQLGIKVRGCSEQKIIRIGRQNTSGTFHFLREKIMGKKQDYKMGTYAMHGSKDVITLVEKTPCAIGYSGLAYATQNVKTACISFDEKGSCVRPSVISAGNKTYPLSRPLYMYTREKPEGIVKEYIDWILSDKGQCILLKKGYTPIRKMECF